MTTTTFDATKYKQATREQWQNAAGAWNEWGLFLRQWLGAATQQMLDMAGVVPGSRVLDVAAGAGEQTLQVAEAVGPKGFVLATDISSNILEFARLNVQRAGHHNVEVRELDGENLELPEASYDTVVCRLGLMLFPHQEQAIRGFHRVLKKNGGVGVIVFTTAENNPFFSVPISIIRRRANLPPLAPGQPGPFSLGDSGVLGRHLTGAGFTNVREKRVSAPLEMESADELVRFQRESFGALHQMLSSLNDEQKHQAWDEIREALRKFETPTGLIAPCELLVVAAQKK